MSTALGVSVDENDNGVTPLTHRLVIGSYFQNNGVVDGLAVSGRNDLKYAVASGLAVVQRAPSDGRMLAYWGGGATEDTVSAGDPSNPRIDVIWIKANNKPEYPTDSDNQVHVGVTQGVPSANPVKPSVPQGCVPIAWRLMPAGATSTQSATLYASVDYAIPYGSNLGRLAEHWWKKDYAGGTDIKKMYYEQQVSFIVPTDRLCDFDFKVSLSANGVPWESTAKRTEWSSDIKKMYYEQQVSFIVPTDRLCDFDFKVSLSANGVPWESTAKRTEWSFCFQLDNQDIPHSGGNFVAHGAWQTFQIIHTSEVPAGRHTARLRCWLQNGVAPYFHYTGDDSLGRQWVGRRFQIFDRGPVV